MKNKVPKAHYRYKVIPEVIKITEPLSNDVSYLNFIGHGIQYDNGLNTHLTTNKEWVDHYYDKYLFSPPNSINRIKTGVNYWNKNTSDSISKINEDARDNFDIDARIEFVYRDDIHECYHLYSFVSNKKNAAQAYHFYDIHRAKLLKFIAYFNKKAAHLISESNKPENLIQIPGYSVDDIDDPRRNYAEELIAENKNTNLSDREFETMLLYAYGLTGKQLAEVFSQSVRTIESQLIKIRQKTKCKDRKELQLHVRQNGWSGLERFFFKCKGVPEITPTSSSHH